MQKSPRLRVLAMNQFFWPGMAPTGVLLTDVTRALAAPATIICGSPDYGNLDQSGPPPVKIRRCATLPFHRGPSFALCIVPQLSSVGGMARSGDAGL
jgi:hypothetical protein